MPLTLDAKIEKREDRSFEVLGKLAPEKTLAGARAEMDILAKRLEKAYPKENKGVAASVVTYNDQYNGDQIRIVFLSLLGAVAFVLLIVCANVTNLLLARSIRRTREISIRTAMGASRFRVVRQLLLESVMLGLFGGVIALGVSYYGVRGFDLATADTGKPYWIDFRMDPVVFAYLAAVCIGSGIVFGIVPAMRISRVNINETLKEGERNQGGAKHSRWLAASLVVGQLSLAMVLLTGAGLMIRSFIAMYGMSSAFDADRIQSMRVNLVEAKYPKPADRERFFDQLLPRLQSIPGVEAVSVASHLPQLGSNGWRIEIEGEQPVEDDKRKAYNGVVIGPAYFRVIGRTVLRGRAFEEADGTPGRQSAIVNQQFARTVWPNGEALGKRFRLRRPNTEDPWLTIVGIAPDIKQNDQRRSDIEPVIYQPYRQMGNSSIGIIARVPRGIAAAADTFRREVRAVDPDLPLGDVRTLDREYERARWPFRVFGTLFSLFATFALILAAVGLYAVISYSVSQKTREIGLRMALGASSGNILQWVMMGGLRQLAIGLAIGAAGAFGVTRVLEGLLVRVKATDPSTFLMVAAVLLFAGVLACYIPARRAMRVHPMEALRYE
jgi:predicted permease